MFTGKLKDAKIKRKQFLLQYYSCLVLLCYYARNILMALTCMVQLFLAILLSWFLALGVCFSTMQAAAIPYSAPTCSRCVKTDSFRGNHIMQALTMEKHVQLIKYDFFHHIYKISNNVHIINKMNMNYWWCHCTTFNVHMFIVRAQTTCINFAKLYFDNILYFLKV